MVALVLSTEVIKCTFLVSVHLHVPYIGSRDESGVQKGDFRIIFQLSKAPKTRKDLCWKTKWAKVVSDVHPQCPFVPFRLGASKGSRNIFSRKFFHQPLPGR